MIRRFFTMHWTGRPTDRPLESLMTIGRCATTAMRPNNLDGMKITRGQYTDGSRIRAARKIDVLSLKHHLKGKE